MVILVGFTALTNNKKLPYPVLLIIAGLIIGFVPSLPNLAMDPDVVFVIMLPPLLYDAASKTSWHEFRTSIRPISALAITLVFFTTVAVAITAHYLIDGFSWPLAFVLGAVVSPPDAVAASGVIKGLGLNKKVMTILEGESLVNDASALVAYRYAVAAVTTGTFVLWKAGLEFLWVAFAGILIGVAIGYLFVEAHRRITNNPVVETCFTLLAPFLSFLAAEQVHVSGVLAVVSTGLLIAWKSPEVFSYQARMRTRILWDTLIFLLHGFVFIMIGLQLPSIVKGLGNYPLSRMLGDGLLISLVTIIVRFIWVFAGVQWQSMFKRWKKSGSSGTSTAVPDNTWKNVLVVAWTGTRGVISLAAALALPLVMENGAPFPQRHAIIFIAFVVIIVTLVVQGLSLPLLIRWLKIVPEDFSPAEEKELELYLASHTVHYIDQELRGYLNRTETEELVNKYQAVITELTTEIRRHKHARLANTELSSAPADPVQNAKTAISKYQRALLLKVHKEGIFSDAAIRKVERKLDINELKLNKAIRGEGL